MHKLLETIKDSIKDPEALALIMKHLSRGNRSAMSSAFGELGHASNYGDLINSINYEDDHDNSEYLDYAHDKRNMQKELQNTLLNQAFHLTEHECKKGVDAMKFPSAAGYTVHPYSTEDSERLRKEYNLEFHGKFKDVNPYDFNYMINMLRSDLYCPKKKHYDYAKDAYRMLTDNDFPLPGSNAKMWYLMKKKAQHIADKLPREYFKHHS